MYKYTKIRININKAVGALIQIGGVNKLFGAKKHTSLVKI